MEPGANGFMLFTVTKGKRPGVYRTLEEAKKQVDDYMFPEVHGFNSYQLAVLCFNSRMASIAAEKASSSQMAGSTPSGVNSLIGCSSTAGGLSQMVAWLPVIPEEELINRDFAIVANMEKWLERFVRGAGPFYGFTVVLPGESYERDLVKRGRFLTIKHAAREDAATEMMGFLLESMWMEVHDYNYAKAKLLRDSNNALRAKVIELEDALRS
ncbi:hypothetical protein PIB30_039709 [Stylosanthes scabra]|uniref:Ribonuclease H1 N-terminal domain-containing protein n=1 Tax=Stylosanthes scabra TaxID=79078 RepID=A0ABU6YBS1_9FABA|nr:hypothetical protein [Stylosanthes scabra]